MSLYLGKRKLKIDPQQAIGKGGEADIYNIGNGLALKLFKPPHHPDYHNRPQEQQMAQQRLAEHQQKLRQFPAALPSRVITPQHWVTDRSGQQILGYTMRLIQGAEVLWRYSDRSFRQQGISTQTVVKILQDLHQTVTQLHAAQVVIGDFNDLNVLVQGTEAYLIDADSFQFGAFPCRVFTARFVDPLRCDPQADRLQLQQPHTTTSDWYAFTVMVMQCLLYVDPYGGLYKPLRPSLAIPQAVRPLRRVTVFHPQVRYPKPALPYGRLPDDLLNHFHRVFEQDWRGQFPLSLLTHLHWQQCPVCGVEHARPTCPDCVTPTPKATVRPTIVVRGNVTATQIFHTRGQIVAATLWQGKPIWLAHAGGKFCREDGELVLTGDRQPDMTFHLWGVFTLIGQGRRVLALAPGRSPIPLAVECYGSQPLVAVSAAGCYWLQQGQLHWQPQQPLAKLSEFTGTYLGDVLANQTQFWVGDQVGFGFYRVGELQTAFIFDTQRRGVNDRLALPRWPGQWVEATCLFGRDRLWFLCATQTGGQRLNHCVVFDHRGTLLGTTTEIADNGSWLAKLQGKCAAGDFLLVATDDGLVRVQLQQQTIVVVKEFPDTEPFVQSQYQLQAGTDGLYVFSEQSICRLQLHP